MFPSIRQNFLHHMMRKSANIWHFLHRTSRWEECILDEGLPSVSPPHHHFAIRPKLLSSVHNTLSQRLFSAYSKRLTFLTYGFFVLGAITDAQCGYSQFKFKINFHGWCRWTFPFPCRIQSRSYVFGSWPIIFSIHFVWWWWISGGGGME